MKDSVVYQEIIEEGVKKGIKQGIEKGRREGAAELRSLILRLGTKALGRPATTVRSRLESIEDLSTLKHLIDRVLDGKAKSWTNLLPPDA